MTIDIGTALLGVAAMITSITGLVATLRRNTRADRCSRDGPGRQTAR